MIVLSAPRLKPRLRFDVSQWHTCIQQLRHVRHVTALHSNHVLNYSRGLKCLLAPTSEVRSRLAPHGRFL